MSFGITELAIILVIVLVLFGTTKLKSIGTDLGSAIKGFKSAVSEEEKPTGSTESTESTGTTSSAVSAEPAVEKKDTH